MKSKLLLILLLGFSVKAYSQSTGPVTYKFADRDTCSLHIDLYKPTAGSNDICVIYVFGGGFVTGDKAEKLNVEFYKELNKRGFTVAAIDYRLGLKGQKRVGALNPRPPFVAVRLATEDLVSATKYLLDNAKELQINPEKIALIGSSAGAITVLQADYEMANHTQITSALPENFRYSSVVAMAGSVFSTKGKPDYGAVPAPTLFFHGTADNVVVYNKIQVLNLGMFGTNALVKIFDKSNFPYMAVRYVDSQHEVAEFPRTYCTDQIEDFITMCADKKYTNQLDITIRDRFVRENFKLELTRKDLYNGN